MSPRYVIVGAGPAGMRAAEQLVRAGVRPVVIDEAPRFGGQIYRQPPEVFRRSRRDLYGFEAGRAAALLDGFAALLPQIDYRPDTMVWQHDAYALQVLTQGRSDTVPYDRVILATGATDRVLPFPGWTLPGVTTLGGAQVALKYQACLIGPQVIFAGSGPLLYLVAWQYASRGAQVLAVLDAAPPGARYRALPSMLARPAVLAKGAYYLARLRLMGVPIHHGVSLLGAEGEERIESLTWQAAGATRTMPCDAVAFGHGLRSETQLADLAGCEFAFSELEQAWLPVRDAAGRSSVRGVYLAGDGAATLGADAAELGGARAALAALQDSGGVVPAGLVGSLERKTRAQVRFRQGIETLTALPERWAAQAPDELIVCRCEEVTAGELRGCVRDTGARDLNRLKALTRIGMGRCQGRMCAPAAARLLAEAAGCSLADAGRLRSQAPVKPLPIAMLRDASPVSWQAPADDSEAAMDRDE